MEIKRKLRKKNEGEAHKKFMKTRTKEASKEPGRPDGEQGLIWDAYKAAFEIKKKWEELFEAFQRLKEYNQKALDLTLADKERSSLHRLFTGAVRNYDYLAKNLKLNDRVLFDGNLKEHPIIFPLDENDDREIKFDMNDYRADALRLYLLRSDSIVHARKTSKKLEEIQEKLNFMPAFYTNKQTFLNMISDSKGFSRPDFENISETPINQAEEEVEEIEIECRAPEFALLKSRIKRAALAKGREKALLVNLQG